MKRKIHYDKDEIFLTECGLDKTDKGFENLELTSILTNVTCKRCLKVIRLEKIKEFDRNLDYLTDLGIEIEWFNDRIGDKII